LPMGMPHEFQSGLDNDLQALHEVLLVHEDHFQENSLLNADPYDPFQNLDDIFSGLSEEDLSDNPDGKEPEGADIAVSTDLTGAEHLGGDWTHEHETGVIQTAPLFQQGVEGFDAVLQDLDPFKLNIQHDPSQRTIQLLDAQSGEAADLSPFGIDFNDLQADERDGVWITQDDIDTDDWSIKIQGTSGDDTILLDGVAFDGFRLQIRTGGGNDTVIINNSEIDAFSLDIDLGSGDDALIVNQSTIDSKFLKVKGSGGEDAIAFINTQVEGWSGRLFAGSGDDHLHSVGSQFDVTWLSAYGGSGSDSISFGNSSVEGMSLSISGGRGDDAIRFAESTAAVGFAGITGSDGDDLLEFYAGSIDAWRLKIDGGRDADTVQLDSTELDVSRLKLRGGDGADTLAARMLDASGETEWYVDGLNTGTVGGVRFSQFETLQGDDESPDHFRIDPAGDVEGYYVGGAGDYDHVTFEPGDH
ncbi:MAG: DUF4347 domain-containing protein, partial [bacterium]|nr:DUF4347 domain-containing protein [bacterium]